MPLEKLIDELTLVPLLDEMSDCYESSLENPPILSDKYLLPNWSAGSNFIDGDFECAVTYR